MPAAVEIDMPKNNYCADCHREFRSPAGLNGHNQWKHNKSAEKVPYTVTGKAVEMFEIVQSQLDVIRDEQETLKDMVQSLHDHGSGNGPPGNGPGNGPGNIQGNGPVVTKKGNGQDDEDEAPGYICNGCRAAVGRGHNNCSSCGKKLDWGRR